MKMLKRVGDIGDAQNGHIHQRMVRTFAHLTIINAGTSRRNHEPGCLTVDFKAGTVQFYDMQNDATIVEAE